ncbi:protease inhibitor [Salmonella enterica subsp. enterica serovar Virchow]|nr:protease inhibitor [Salmonella enterica subsp. enterica serovar Virchow]MIL10006.1 protease inhibitor [Salmonella enterica subsp. enterica serovar Enteritidis]
MNKNRYWSLARWSALGAAAVVLSSCVVVEDNGGPRPRPPRPGPVACTMEYNPVCGIRGGERRTFSNACTARASGFRISAPGECRANRPPPRPGGVCTREYNPVCARRGDRIRTFGNACSAEVEGYRVIGRGQC